MKWFEKGDARLLMLAAACNDTGADTDTIETLLRRFPDDVWVQKTLLANSPNTAGRYLALLIKAQPRDWNYTPQRAEFVKSLSRCCGTDGFDLTDLLALLKSTAGQPAWWKFAILQGLSEGLPRRTNDTYPNAKSLTQLATMKLEGMEIAQAEITTLLAQADNTIADPSAPLDQRLAVLPLLAQRPQAQLEPILTTLLAADQPAELQAAAIAVVKKLSVKKLAPLLYQLLPTLGPVSKREVIATLITANPIEVMTKMEHGEISKSLADAEKRWALLKTGSADTRALAERVFGKPSEDRAAVIADYASTLTLKGASKNGHLIFQSICIACHKVRGEGNDIGPDITDVRTKAPEALLSDILDPNRMCETRWSAYQIDTKDGKILVGLVAAETTSGVTLKGPGLNEEVPRSNIAKMTSLDRTLMPPGLEAAINKQQMADLLAFLRGE
jgi:putative heme-binding domain-containing protein